MIPTIVCWKWKAPVGYRSTFTAEHVNALRAMVARHYQKPHRFVCVTDDPTGLRSDVEAMALWSDLASVPNPHGSHNPSCYRRLKLFAPTAAKLFGERVISIDLDTVIVGDLAPLFDRTDDFIIWGQSDFPKTQWYNGSLWSLRTGSRPQVWEQFNPKTSPYMAARAGKRGSDQGWLSYILGPKEQTWGIADGVYSYRVHIVPRGGTLPANAKIVAFHGAIDPWHYKAQQLEWVRDAWGVAA